MENIDGSVRSEPMKYPYQCGLNHCKIDSGVTYIINCWSMALESLKALRICCKAVTLLMNVCCMALCVSRRPVSESLNPLPNASTMASINCEDVRSTNTERFASTGHVSQTSSSDRMYVIYCMKTNNFH